MAMHSHENKSKNNSGNHSPSNAPSPFQARAFDIQTKSEPEQASSLQEEIDAQGDRANPYSTNLLNIPIYAPGTEALPPVQPKLTIGQPGDQYEQEADSVAAQVVSQIHSPSFSQLNQGAVAQRQSEEEGEKEELKEVVQAKSLASPPPEDPSPKTQPEISQRPDTNLLSRISIFQPGTAAPPPIQTMSFGQAESERAAQPNLESSIQQARGGGQPLADSIRQPMEQAFGANFSGVRVHTGAQSDQMNQSIQAKAFTTGQDVFFRDGAYDPGSRGGQELIAHELTHVVQQNPSTSQTQISPKRMSVTPTSTNKIQRGGGKDGYDNLDNVSDDEKSFQQKLGVQMVAAYRIMSDATEAMAKGKDKEALKKVAIGLAQAGVTIGTMLLGVPSLIPDPVDMVSGNFATNFASDAAIQEVVSNGLEMGLDQMDSDAVNPMLAKGVQKTTIKGVLQNKLNEKFGSISKAADTIFGLVPLYGAAKSIYKGAKQANQGYDDWNKQKASLEHTVMELVVYIEEALALINLEDFGNIPISVVKKNVWKTTEYTLTQIFTKYREKSEEFKVACEIWNEKHEYAEHLLTPDPEQKQDFSKLNPEQENLSLDDINKILSS